MAKAYTCLCFINQNSLLSPSRPLANQTLWEIRFLECVLTQNFDIRSKYSSTRDRCPDSEAASESVSCLHICVRGRKTSSLLAFPRQVEEVLTQTFSHRLINLCSFPAQCHQHVETPSHNRPPCKGYKNSNAFCVNVSEAILSVGIGGLSWSNL